MIPDNCNNIHIIGEDNLYSAYIYFYDHNMINVIIYDIIKDNVTRYDFIQDLPIEYKKVISFLKENIFKQEMIEVIND